LVLTNLLRGQALYQLSNHAKTASGWGMGSAVSTLSNNIDGIFQNPALLANSPEFYHVNFTNFVVDINSTTINAAFHHNWFNYAVNISYMNFGDFVGRDNEGLQTGNFSANDKEITLAVGKKLGNYISLGLSGSFLNSNIDNYSATNLAATIGLQYFNPATNLSLGLSYKNMDRQVSSYNDHEEKIPNLFILGISKKLQYLPAKVSFDLLKYSDLDLLFNTGIRFDINQYFNLFLGTSSRKLDLQNRTDLKSLTTGISAGAGLQISNFNLDISYTSLGDAGEITSFSFYKILD
jgi:hypothetical protein